MKKQVFKFLSINFLKVCNFQKARQFLIFNTLIINCLCPSVSTPQETEMDMRTIYFAVQPVYGGQKINLDGSYFPLSNKDSVQLSVLKFYLSSIEFLNDDITVWTEPNSVHLMDLEEPNSLAVRFNVPKNRVFNRLKCHLGIDSLTNVSGALGGDLDPTKGMYWAWQSGYINFKLEGKSPVCPTRKNAFQFHLGGYLFPNNCLQTIDLQIDRPIGDTMVVQLNIQDFLSTIDLKQQNSVMIPSEEAVDLAKKIAQLFRLKSD